MTDFDYMKVARNLIRHLKKKDYTKEDIYTHCYGGCPETMPEGKEFVEHIAQALEKNPALGGLGIL